MIAARVVEDFVDRFARAWAHGGSAAMLTEFAPAVRPDSRFVQPLEKALVGPDDLRAFFGRVYTLIPDLRGRVVRWAAHDDGVMIELELYGTLGGRPVRWSGCDRILLDAEGRIVERRAYFDPSPLVLTVLRRPRAWRSWWASGLAVPGR
ncbi:nuclear transport factor 2 family protein [Thermomonospora umbrina]|uniref:SnoaL-like protein n=1 Tax=Thermomonospora umbrina TaxID=111806 RepID=A0A3D9SQN5_9ACTN|nr:nuclear transport factor 2 family protein [Thermomonospora umbrina]REE98272.1 SnoaL-like protein [Thermomonospora umbrina]